MSELIQCLQERGLIDALTSEELRSKARSPLKVYVGFDPTADSLHLGNFLGIVALSWFQRFGHTPVVVLGGATGRIGDPSGKSKERPLLDDQTISYNISRIRQHFEKVLDFTGKLPTPVILNNDEWFSRFYFIDFLRDVGKHFRIGTMLAKESVRSRVQSEEGMSYTEFSYQLLQAYDFYHLFKEQGVCLQMGGSDQWGNITAGTDLIRKLLGETAYGLTFPLLTRSDGKKFGKSEEGAVWLAEDKFSAYQFYQYLIRVPDADVIKLMKMLTFMDLKEIQEYESLMQKADYIPNTVQKRLAQELTLILHGKEGLEKALKVTEGAGPGSLGTLNVDVIEQIAGDMPNIELEQNQVIGRKFTEVAVLSGLLTSKGEAVRLIQNQGAYLNNEKVEDPALVVTENDLIGGKYLLLGSGKKKKILVRFKHS
jgi:tyrosyl-tRNA synthetase